MIWRNKKRTMKNERKWKSKGRSDFKGTDWYYSRERRGERGRRKELAFEKGRQRKDIDIDLEKTRQNEEE